MVNEQSPKPENTVPRPIARIHAAIGLTAVAMANLATIFGYLSSVAKKIFDSYGFKDLEQFHGYMVTLISLLSILGYSFLAVWAFKRFIGNKTINYRIGFGLCALLGAATLAYAQIRLLPPPPALLPILESVQVDAVKDIVSYEGHIGGIRFSRDNASDESQTWTTGQALYALLTSNVDEISRYQPLVKNGFRYIETYRLAEPNDGWGYVNSSTWGVTEINAWVTLAYLAAIGAHHDHSIWSESEYDAAIEAVRRNLRELVRRQHPDGGWGPNMETNDPSHIRTYSTTMALWALVEARKTANVLPYDHTQYDININQASQWLMANYRSPTGWVPFSYRRNESDQIYPGLTAQTLFVLERAANTSDFLVSNRQFKDSKLNFLRWAEQCVAGESQLFPCRMEVNERVHDSDRYLSNSNYTAEASTFLWYPWTMAALLELRSDAQLEQESRDRARDIGERLAQRANEFVKHAQRDAALYPTLEGLIVVNLYLSSSPGKATHVQR